MPPRGIRNNNPGNIEKGPAWEGLDPKGADPRFATFVSPEYGIRAICRILITYQGRHKLNTVRGIINRWAPPVENDTGAYVSAVAAACGVGPDAPISVTDPTVMRALVEAIIRHENGQQPYSPEIINKGLQLAGLTLEDDHGARPAPSAPVVEVSPDRGVWLVAVLRRVFGLLARLGRRQPAE